MYDKYLVTGATGFLGRAVVEELARRDAQVRALVLPDDPYAHLLPEKVRSIAGDVCDKDALASFFADADSRTCVIHCAGIVSVASRPGPKLYQVNVGGTWKDPPAMYSPQCGKNDLCQLRSRHTGKAQRLPHYGGLQIFPGACRRRLRQEQGHCHRSGLGRSGPGAECQHHIPLRHHRPGRCAGRELHLYGQILSCRKAALCRSRRI